MKRRLILYGVVMAMLLASLKYAEYKLVIIDHAWEMYIGIVAVLFTVLGAALGARIMRDRTAQTSPSIHIPAAASSFLPQSIIAQPVVPDSAGLSRRELEILQLIAEGLSNQEIADRSFLSIHTVKTHVSNILLKLDAKRRTQAVIKAREMNLL